MAVARLACVVAIVLSSAGCSEKDSGASHAAAAYVDADSLPHVVDSTDRNLVLRARAFDRADKLDSARILYEEAARNLRPIRDWLYLRAAGVTTDASDRQKYFRDLKTEVAKSRREPTEAIALERSGKIRRCHSRLQSGGPPTRCASSGGFAAFRWFDTSCCTCRTSKLSRTRHGT